MAILIDGYNLLHVTGIIGRDVGVGTLQRARAALLNYLTSSLDADELSMTTVVFDAHNPPPDRPNEYRHMGITVRYATGYDDADSLLEELIQANSSPRSLTVVSSDHRVQRAATRRRATAIDSDVWYDEVGRKRHPPELADLPSKPVAALTEAEVEFWLERFSDPMDDGDEAAEPQFGTRLENRAAKAPKSNPAASAGLANPFPPGYADDLLEEE